MGPGSQSVGRSVGRSVSRSVSQSVSQLAESPTKQNPTQTCWGTYMGMVMPNQYCQAVKLVFE